MADSPATNATPLPETNASPRDIASWGLANVFAQKFAVEGAALSQASQGRMQPPPMIPFGSTYNVTTNNQTSGMGKLAQAALVAAAVGGGGLGLAAMFGGGDAVADSVAPAAGNLTPKIVEGIIDWEFDPDGGFSIRPDGGSAVEDHGQDGGDGVGKPAQGG